MNAKKIMGAVLVALLAAALFVGAGAAAYTAPVVADGDTVFVYQIVDGTTSGTLAKGTWANGANTITFESVDGGVAIIGTDIVEGTYTKGEYSIIVKYPTAVITGIAGDTNAEYSFIGGNLYKSDIPVAGPLSMFTSATGISAISAEGYVITGSNGVPVKLTATTELKAGEYKIQAYFNKDAFVKGIPANYLYGAVYTFNVVGDDEATVVADVNSILKGDIIKLTITAQPGALVEIKGDAFKTVDGQMITYDGSKIVVPNTGKLTIAVTTKDTAKAGDETIEVIVATSVSDVESYEFDITIQKGTLTAAAEKASYFVGDTIVITGTSTAGDVTDISLKGTNFGPVPITGFSDEDNDAKAFKFEIETAGIKYNNKKLDVGTYTITLNASGVKATVPVALKQPFITIINAPEVIVQGADDADFVIGAEATTGIRYYIFGTNYFNASDLVEGPEEDTTNQFEFTLPVEETQVMDPGQYFMVIQHPMYDGAFNILAFDEAFYLNTSGDAVKGTGFLFNVDARQTANAAQALCDALDSQNIDDMYVKYSFFVVGEDESFVINPIPETVAKGTTLVISGVDTANAEETVLVEMISTAFAAVPKDTVGSAAFVAVTTTVAEDGTWEVTLDTSELNIDEYALTVKIAENVKKNVNINVVEAADKPDTPDTPDVPDTPDTPDTPTEPETPGFGALAALAGLGAVAVLLLRRE